jgi:hypothetical protein
LSSFAFDYVIFVFGSALGVLQFTFARAGLNGLLFLRPWPRLTQVLALVVVAGTSVWFFGSEPRNIPDTGAGLEANSQAWMFAVATATAGAAIFLITSVIHHRWGRDHGWNSETDAWPPAGVDWLRRTTFARALGLRFKAMARRVG